MDFRLPEKQKDSRFEVLEATSYHLKFKTEKKSQWFRGSRTLSFRFFRYNAAAKLLERVQESAEFYLKVDCLEHMFTICVSASALWSVSSLFTNTHRCCF